jgi:hypothetical protein
MLGILSALNHYSLRTLCALKAPATAQRLQNCMQSENPGMRGCNMSTQHPQVVTKCRVLHRGHCKQHTRKLPAGGPHNNREGRSTLASGNARLH